MKEEITEKKTNLLDLNLDEIISLVKENGEKSFRAGQMFQWIYKYGIFNFNDMTDLSKAFRAKLGGICEVSMPENVQIVRSSDGMTEKFAFELVDGNIVEAVKIYDGEMREKYTVCLSTQVGCPIDCAFCQTGRMGFIRNLTAGEIMAQLLGIVFEKKDSNEGLSNIVYMGMGEPFLNYDAVIKSARMINHEAGLNVSMRKITVSTSGVVPGILKLIDEQIPMTLAISLHAADDELRSRLVPLNKKYNISDILNAVKKYIKETSRRVTFEYVMIKGVNDSDSCVENLVRLLKGMLCHVNLIGLNKTEGGFEPSSNNRIFAFRKALEDGGLNATIRRSKGEDINAACGMLYKKLKNRVEDKIDEI
ncbi:MAG TPA: 23S rRNA (adenine(2503)-C(2))-methyltransferase RlmN [Candidatus Wallbacteria bacterium]|nr:23S rRNA (adenine(2503)-C(2))-methyltransferase RlmN [Candidatus Wallbacteria bacterium]